jgi:autotransporter-associated beta strand protein
VASPGANNWNVNANWSPNTGNPGASDTAIFGPIGTTSQGSINNIVSVNTTVTALTFTNFTSGTWHVTQIPANVTLGVSGNLFAGAMSNFVGSGVSDGSFVTTVQMLDAGTLAVHGNLTVGVSGTNGASTGSMLDMSGLTNFIYTNITGTIAMGVGSRGSANIKLAAGSNYITAGTMNLDTSSSSSSTSGTFTLGAGTNIINVNNFNASAQRSSCTVTFPGSGGLRLRGTNGTDADRATMTIGFRQASGSGGTTTGTLSLNGDPVDMKINTLTAGWSTNVTGNVANGTINFDTGIIDATNVVLGITRSAGCTATGTINVGANAQLVIGDGGLTLGNMVAGTSATGNIGINGGTVSLAGNIVKGTASGVGNITNTSGTLNMGAHTIGIVGTPIDNLNLTDSTNTLPSISGSPAAVVSTLTINGSTDTINVSEVPSLGQFVLISYTTLNGAFDFVAGTLPDGFQGYISNNVANSSVDLVVTNTTTRTDTWMGNVNGNWDTTTANWLISGHSATYLNGDIAVFDDTLTGRTNVILTTTLQPLSVSVNNTSSNYVFSGAGSIAGNANLVKGGTGSLILTETGGDSFSNGVAVNGGTLVLDNANSTISGGLTISSGATAQIGNNDVNGGVPSGSVIDDGTLIIDRSDSVALATGIPGTGSLVQLGNGTLTLSSVNGYTGDTLVLKGTLTLSGASAISNSANVGVSSATLDISAVSPAVTTLNNLNITNAVLTLGSSNSVIPPLNVASLNMAGAGNTINVTALPPIASFPTAVTLIQSQGAVGGYNATLGTLPAGFTGTLTNNTSINAIQLIVTSGTTSQRPFVTWTGADYLVNGNLNTNWTDNANWQLPGEPVAGDNVIFNGTGASGSSALSTPGGGIGSLSGPIDNYVNANFTLSSLVYTNFGGLYHNTFINSGDVLAVTNSGLNIGAVDTGSAGSSTEFVTISGTKATLSINNTNANVQVWLGDVSGSQATLDMSALDTFNSTNSRVVVGATINNVVNRPSGVLYLAKTNNITAVFQSSGIDSGTTTANAGIVVADANSNAGSASGLFLGQVNSITADTIAVGRQKASGGIQFNPIYVNTAPYPTLTVQGFSSSAVSIWEVGNGVGNTGTTTLSATNDFTGGIVNASVSSLIVGRASSGTGSGTTTGTLNFDAGTINAASVTIGLQPSGGSKVGNGNFGVASNTIIGAAANLNVSGSLTLASAGSASGSTGNLNITNGTVSANSIVAGTNATSTINLIGGRLNVATTLANAAAPLSALNLTPLGTADNTATVLQLPASTNASAVVTTLTIDGTATTTNILNISSVATVTPPAELPVIQYTGLNVNGGIFNLGLGTLPAGYSGFLTNDTSSNTIAVVITSAPGGAPSTNANITHVSLSGTNLLVHGTNNNVPNTSFHYAVLTATNLNTPLSNWTIVTTNAFNANGTFDYTNPIVPGAPRQFIDIKAVP